jgi:beta-lactam-binding protein with PASTA domain
MGFKMKSKELIEKTGTAQIADTKHGGYLDGTHNVIVSFSGLYPKKDPKVIIYASVKKPTNGAQKPLSNAIKEIVNNIARYYGEESDTDTKVEAAYTLPNLENKTTEYAKTILKNNKITYRLIGKGNKITHQIPKANTKVTSQETIYLITNDSNMKVPDVTGISGTNAKEILETIGLSVKIEGVGYVKAQSIKKNSSYKKGEVITLKLKNNF